MEHGFYRECEALQSRIVSMRRDLHRIPEIGTDLPKTRAYVTAQLDALGIPYSLNKGDSGIIAEIKGGKPGKRVAFRADMDALCVTEKTGLPFASMHEGRMHACGHDAHTAMLLGAAEILNKHRQELCGSVRLLFQTAEENTLGALQAIKEGCLEDVDAVFGTHIGTLLGKTISAGKMIISRGCCMASTDRFILTVKGVGCHGSSPEKGIDPVHIAAHVILALEGIEAREVSAREAAVVTVGSIHGGEENNVIPNEVTLWGTIRTLNPAVRDFVVKRIEEIAKGTAAAFGGSVDCVFDKRVPAVVNDAGMAMLAERAAIRAIGEENVLADWQNPIMAGEDFAWYLMQKPGCFMFLSSSNPEKGTDQAHHSSLFDVDEDVLYKGSAVFVSIAEEYLNGEGKA